jgi:hypothetical protein
MAITLSSITANEIYGVRSPLPLAFSAGGLGEFLKIISVDLKIWVGDKVTNKPSTPTYSISLGTNTLGTTLQYHEIDVAELVREYIDTDAFNYPSTYNSDWAAWLEIDWSATNDSGMSYTGAPIVMCTNGFRPYEQPTLPLSTYYFPTEVRVPSDHSYFITVLDKGVTGADRPVNKIRIKYNSGVETELDFGTAGTTTASLFKTATLTWNPSDTEAEVQLINSPYLKYVELVEGEGGRIDGSEACFLESLEAELQDDFIVHSFKVKKYCKAKYGNVMVGYVNRIGVVDYQYFFGKTEKKQTANRELYKPALNNTYTNANSQYRVLMANGKLPITVNTDWVTEETREKIRDILLTEYAFEAQGTTENETVKAINPTDSEQVMKVDDNELSNYTLSFEYAYDYINSVQ